jgi:hypothetical protein
MRWRRGEGWGGGGKGWRGYSFIVIPLDSPAFLSAYLGLTLTSLGRNSPPLRPRYRQWVLMGDAWSLGRAAAGAGGWLCPQFLWCPRSQCRLCPLQRLAWPWPSLGVLRRPHPSGSWTWVYAGYGVEGARQEQGVALHQWWAENPNVDGKHPQNHLFKQFAASQ